MKPARFEYIRPSSTDEAVLAMMNFDGEARLLAGGQSLVPLMNLRLVAPAALIDLAGCGDLIGLRQTNDGLLVGAMVRQSAAELSQLVRACSPLVSMALPFVGSPAIRNRGTIGGTLAHADRCAELPAVAVALRAKINAQSPEGRRSIGADDFFLGDLTTALRPNEVLHSVVFPIARPADRFAFVEAANRHHDLATVAVAVAVAIEDGVCTEASLVASGVTDAPVRLHESEACLIQRAASREVVGVAASAATSGLVFADDLHASAAYRRHVLPGLVKRAVTAAIVGQAHHAH